MALFNIFSDPALKARQDQLDGQWNSLQALYSSCNNTPDASFAEFATDFRLWKEFYNSGSDWSADSKRATDEWQTKAQEWSRKLASWGCTGNTQDANGDPIPQSGDAGIPTVKDNPPDQPGLLDSLNPLPKLESWAETVGWVVVGLVVLAILAVVWISTKGHAKGPGGLEVGA